MGEVLIHPRRLYPTLREKIELSIFLSNPTISLKEIEERTERALKRELEKHLKGHK